MTDKPREPHHWKHGDEIICVPKSDYEAFLKERDILKKTNKKDWKALHGSQNIAIEVNNKYQDIRKSVGEILGVTNSALPMEQQLSKINSIARETLKEPGKKP